MYQKLLTKQNLKDLPPLYSQEKNPDPMVWVKFFPPWGRTSYYMTEYDPGSRTFFGWITPGNELGYFSLDELQAITGPYGLKIERDMHFDPTPLSEVKALHGIRVKSEPVRYTSAYGKPAKSSRKKSTSTGLGGTR